MILLLLFLYKNAPTNAKFQKSNELKTVQSVSKMKFAEYAPIFAIKMISVLNLHD